MTNLFGHSVRSELLLLSVTEALACFAAFALILHLGLPPGTTADLPGILVLSGVLAICASFAVAATGLYHPTNSLRAARLFAGAVLGGLLLVIVAPVAAHMLPHAPLPGIGMSVTQLVVAFVCAVLLTRSAFFLALRSGLLRLRVALLPGPGSARLRGRLAADPFYAVLDGIPPGLDAVRPRPLERVLRTRPLDAVVADDPASLPPGEADRLRSLRIPVWSTSRFVEHALGQVDLEALPQDWRPLETCAEGAATAAFRRGLDVVIALAILLLALPVMILTVIAIRLDSPGPILYRQQRLGQHGRVFTVFKFRSMREDAEAGGAVWARPNDTRVTRVGRFIRLVRIDELPQLINVLRGEMAIVGPRPERPEFVARLAEAIPHYEARMLVKPGITGWAQVNCPYGASVEDARLKLSYDLYYVCRRSVFLDLLILIATVRVVLFQEGSR